MKLTVFLMLFAISRISNAQTETQSIDRAISDLRKSLSSLTKVCSTSKNGNSCSFFRNDTLIVKTVKTNEAGTFKSVEWYFIDGLLAYCETNWTDEKSRATVFSEKCYLHGGRLISWWNSKENAIDPSGEKFKKLEVELVTYGKKIASQRPR